MAIEQINNFVPIKKGNKGKRTFSKEEVEIMFDDSLSVDEKSNKLGLSSYMYYYYANQYKNREQESKKPKETNLIPLQIVKSKAITITNGEVILGDYTITGSFTLIVNE